MERVNLVILGATPAEIAPIAASPTRIHNAEGAGPRTESLGSTPPILSEAGVTGLVRNKRDVKFAGNTFSTYIYCNLKLLVGTTGLGKVNAAAITAAVLSNFEVEEVWKAGARGPMPAQGWKSETF